jgi:hypothetical protein
LSAFLLLCAYDLGVSPLVALEALFDLEPIVIQLGFEQLEVDNNATFDYSKLKGLGR